MVGLHAKGIMHCSCADALDPAQAIQSDKCNLTRFFKKIQI